MLKIKRLLAGMLSVLTLFSLVACQEEEQILMDDTTLLFPDEIDYKTTSAFIGEFTYEVKSSLSMVYSYQKSFSFETSGYFKEYQVEQGDVVQEGDIIAVYTVDGDEISLEEKKLELERMYSEYDRAIESYQLELESSEQVLENLEEGSYEYQIQELNMEKSAISHEQYKYNNSRSIESLEESIQELENALSDQYLKAPHSGEITNLVTLKEGDTVTPNTNVVTITSSDTFLFKAEISEGLNWGQEVDINVTNQGETSTVTGTIIATPSILSSELSGSSCYIKVNTSDIGDISDIEEADSSSTANTNTATNNTATNNTAPSSTTAGPPSNNSNSNTDDSDTDIDFGSMFSISLTAAKQYMPDVLLLENKAVTKDGTTYYIDILEDGIIKRRYISVAYSNSDYYWVDEGLTEDQIVVIE